MSVVIVLVPLLISFPMDGVSWKISMTLYAKLHEVLMLVRFIKSVVIVNKTGYYTAKCNRIV